MNTEKSPNKVTKSKYTNIYLICEGTSCEFVEKSMEKRGTSKHSCISDYGLLESYYFNHNPNNTRLFQDSNSIYLSSTKGSCIDSAFMIFGNTQSSRKLYPIPYAAPGKYIKSTSDLRILMDELGSNQNVNNYMKQPKFAPLSSYLPSYNVQLDWSLKSNQISDYTSMNVSKFLLFVKGLMEKDSSIENIFLVCDASFIVAMMNATNRNKHSSNDYIEHTSFWNFQVDLKKERTFWGSTSPKVLSRNKIYPLARNHGLLQQYNQLFFYLYKDIRVPLFHYNKPVPKNYLKSSYLSLCYGIRNRNRVRNQGDEPREKRSNQNTFKKILQKARLNEMVS